jgi:transposase
VAGFGRRCVAGFHAPNDNAALAGLVPKRRGRKPDPNAALVSENQRLVQENAKLMRKLRRAEAILDVQKKLSEILGIELPPNDYVKEP